MPLICPTCQVAFSNAGGRLLLCMGLFSIFWERAPSKGEFSNVTRSYAGKGTVRHALVGPAYEYPRGA